MSNFEETSDKINAILNSISEDEKEMLESWASKDSAHSIAAGGIGQNTEQANAAEEAWEKLSENTKQKYEQLKKLHVKAFEQAKQEFEEATNETAPDDPEVVIGDDYELWRYLSVHDIN